MCAPDTDSPDALFYKAEMKTCAEMRIRMAGMKGKRKRIISLLLAASVVFAASGCGDSTGGQEADGGSTAEDNKQGQVQNGENTAGEEPVAMGRYVEKETDLTEFADSPMDLCVREDGKLVLMDRNVGMLVSEDQGDTWNAETPDWLSDYKKDGIWISGMWMAPDGTVALSYYEGNTNAEDPTWCLVLILPDGTRVPVEADMSEEEQYFRQAAMGNDSRIYASTGRGVYEIQRDGSKEKVIALEATPSWICVRDNLLFVDNEWNMEDAPLIYDMEAGEYVTDEVLSDFVGDSYQGRFYNGSEYGSMFLLPGKDGAIYVMGQEGIHRHVTGGNMMEQIVDGGLSLLGNPDYYTVDAIQLDGDAFLALFTGGKLIRFTYDPNVPAVPENMLTLYSLKENDSVRQAISYYQIEHPDAFVSYRIGMGDDDSVTREDALKKLNTEIMAGEGPDLIVLDDMPLDSYVEKGMLLDLTEYLSAYSAKDPLFDNVIEALKRDGKAYVAPATVSVPRIAFAADGMENVTDLSDVAEIIENLRQQYPSEDILGISGSRGILKRFAPASEPAWVSVDGTIDKECIGAYLEQCKRIYAAQMDGLDEKVRDYYDQRNIGLKERNGIRMDEMEWEIFLDVMSYVGGEQHAMAGWDSSTYSSLELLSLDRTEGYENTKIVPMQGQCDGVFMPKTMLGISAASGQTERALEFMDIFLSAKVQSVYDGFPLNQAAYDAQFVPSHVDESGVYSSLATSDGEGRMIEYVIYWPADEEIAALKEELAAVHTAYIPDRMLEESVCTQGAAYLDDEKTLEDALREIEKAVQVYMAE